MTWSEYVVRICGSDQGRDFEAKTGLDGSTLSRWKSGRGGGVNAEKVAAFARGYGRPVLEAFVEAGFISEEEAGAAPPGKPNLDAITNAELIELIRQRLEQRAGEEHGHRSAPIGIAPDPLVRVAAKRGVSTGRQARREQDEAGEAPDPDGPDNGA